MKSGYVVNGGTVRGVLEHREAGSGTEPEQIRYKSGTEPVQNRDRSETEVGHLQGGVGTNRSEGNRE